MDSSLANDVKEKLISSCFYRALQADKTISIYNIFPKRDGKYN